MATQLRQRALLSRKAMEQLTTERLLAYRNRLYSVPESAGHHDEYGLYVHKGHDAWKQAMGDLKEILAGREHVPNKSRIRRIRQDGD
jgi:hypothetical protein